ncbi:MAG: translocation/assembly module TamB domain-containing protein [Nitrospirae bacterium]|nr:translocation/assembly module TamB domain-containing protein [Nitrospirota bacterium]
MKNKLTRRVLLLGAVIFAVGLLFFLLRGPYLSNSIKRVILPVLEQATGERVIIDSAAINLFPLYLQAKGLKVFDKDGDRLLLASKIRAYTEFSGLLFREIRIRRLTVREPELTIEKKELGKVISSVKKYLSEKQAEDISVKLKSAKITDGKFTFSDAVSGTTITGNELSSNIAVKNFISIGLSLKDARLKTPDLPEIKGSLEGMINTDGEKFEFSGLKVSSSGSAVNAEGTIASSAADKTQWGSFSAKAKILVSTIREFFNLKKGQDGELSLDGTVNLIPDSGLKIRMDLKTTGWFYLETLMELLKVEDTVSGLVSFNGKIQGIYPDLSGEAGVTLKNGMFGNLPMDDVSGALKYSNRQFSLKDFTAHTYNGELKGHAYLSIPEGDYSIIADVKDLDSPEFLKFIEWEPPFPRGKISGNFKLTKIYDRDFDIKASVSYTNTSKEGPELTDRLKSIKGKLALKDNSITFDNARFSTAQSDLFINGRIDFNTEKLNLDIDLTSRDVLDLTAPYYAGLNTQIRFRGKGLGSSDDPEISGKINAGPGSINGIPFTSASGDIIYSIKSLLVRSLKIENYPKGPSDDKAPVYDISGSINFRKAAKLFSFDSPYYDAEAVIKNGDAETLITAIYKSAAKKSSVAIPVKGPVSGRLYFKGNAKDFSGNGDISLDNGMVLNQIVDHAVIRAELSPQKIDFPSAELNRGRSRLHAKGFLYFDERFDASIYSDSIELQDLTPLTDSSGYLAANINGKLSADIKCSGTLKNPEAKFSLNVFESSLRNADIGKGTIKGELKNNRFLVKGSFIEDTVAVDAAGVLAGPPYWDMAISFKKGSYDFLLSEFFKDAPGDLSVSLEGNVHLKGRGGNLNMDSSFSYINIRLYGYNIKNKGDAVFALSEKELTIKPFLLYGKDAEITVSGIAKVGQSYDIALEGRMNLEPLQSISRVVESVRGQGNFTVGISGPWENPEFRGKVNIRNSSVMISGFPYRIGPLNGDVFFDKNKVVFDSFNADFAGGKIALSGTGYLKKLTLRGLSLTSTITGIKFRPVEGVSAAFDGKLYFDYSQKGQSLVGDIYVKKAIYAKRVEWKSGLLALRGTKIKKPAQVRVIPAYLGRTRLNVHIYGQDNISIDNNLAKTPVKIDLAVTGTAAQYGLIGRLEAAGGSIFFRSNELKIISGNADFVESNRITPVFHIQAETYTKGYLVRLNLDGPVDKFTLSLFSDPPLSDTDILTLLTVGQVSKTAKGFESGIGAGEAAAFLTGGLQEVMEERFKYITGFERFEVDPHTTSTGAVSPKVTVGKRLFMDKVFVTYSTSIGTTEENIIKIEYNLGRNISLVGSRDEIGSVGADIKYRFEFK